jgi:Zn-finger nucleic acid-binding protein/DNA-directed RNA polymerase subunit RPC12/RpoP
MRLLVACPYCKRQYDASQLTAGQNFRCQCGHSLTVQGPRPHEATAVCCSHCGAPRTEDALSCAYCGADFTLHERDLDTVCPHCFARVSNSARFCEFCGKAIHPETAAAGKPSNLTCPSCGAGHLLTSRGIDEVSAMECERCGGLWMTQDDFQLLTKKAASESLNIEPRQLLSGAARAAHVDLPADDGKLHYHPCAVCQQLMVKQNFAHRSGVMVDVCRPHGVWLEADALSRIVDWIHGGGLAKANQEAADEALAAQQRAEARVEAELLKRDIQLPQYGPWF